MQEIELAPFERPAGRSVCRIVGIRLHAFHMTDMLNLVDGPEAAAARLAAGDEAGDGCKDAGLVSHLGTGAVCRTFSDKTMLATQEERMSE